MATNLSRYAVRELLEAPDPLTGQRVRPGPKKLHLQMATGDTVVPNTSTQRPPTATRGAANRDADFSTYLGTHGFLSDPIRPPSVRSTRDGRLPGGGNALLSLLPAAAYAGGFAISETNAAVTGRAGTAIARDANPSSVHYNPAGLSGIEGVAATAGAAALLPSATATDPSTDVGRLCRPRPQAPSARLRGLRRQGTSPSGFGFNAPFGGGLKWPKRAGQFDLVEMQLQVLGFHAGAAWAVTPQLSLGGGGPRSTGPPSSW